MAHEISVKLSKRIEVLNTDVEVIVKSDGRTLGTLTLSRGTIDWRPNKKHHGKKNETQLTWAEFDRSMQERKKA